MLRILAQYHCNISINTHFTYLQLQAGSNRNKLVTSCRWLIGMTGSLNIGIATCIISDLIYYEMSSGPPQKRLRQSLLCFSSFQSSGSGIGQQPRLQENQIRPLALNGECKQSNFIGPVKLH